MYEVKEGRGSCMRVRGGAEGACESTCGGRRPCMDRVTYEGKGGSCKGTCLLG